MSSLSEARTTTKPTIERLMGISADEFLSRYFGREPLYVPASSSRPLVNIAWEDINRALNTVAPFPQVRLLERAKDIAPERYTFFRQELATDEPYARQRYVDPQRAQKLMTEGATLVMTATPHLTPELNETLRGLRHDLMSDARVDVVATLTSTPAFSSHWDHTDCFNVQLAGKKRWKLYRPVRPWPLGGTQSFPRRTDYVDLAAPPVDAPTQEIEMTVGDWLYVPRGWWHLVTPEEMPCLHLAIGTDPPTVGDAFAWHIDRLKSHDIMRQPIPHWLTGSEWQAFASALQTTMSTAPEDVVTSYLRDRMGADERTPFDLPKAGAGILPAQSDMLVRLRRTGHLAYLREGRDLVFQEDGHTYRFTQALAPAADRLSRAWIAFDEMAQGLDPLIAQAFVLRLWSDGILSIADARQISPEDRMPRWTASPGH